MARLRHDNRRLGCLLAGEDRKQAAHRQSGADRPASDIGPGHAEQDNRALASAPWTCPSSVMKAKVTPVSC